MQQWQGEALLLKADKFGDHDAIVYLFSPEHGLGRGVVKAGMSSKRRADMQPGTLVDAVWKARLPEHMGSITLEAKHSFAARVMHDPLKLAAVGSILSLLSVSLADADPHPELYAATITFLQHTAAGSDPVIWLAEYVRLELALLEEVGFGLDLTSCVATGATEDLAYVSPKSARAVGKTAGEPYAAKLLALPGFLSDNEPVPDSISDIGQGVALTGYFLETRLLPALQRNAPPLREHFVSLLFRQLSAA